MFRPYIYGFVTSWVADSISIFSDHTWVVDGVISGINTYQLVTFRPEFLTEHTNHLTFDHILSNYYYVNVPGGPLATLPVNLRYHRRPSNGHLYMSIDSLGFSDLYYLDLPPYPTAWGIIAQ